MPKRSPATINGCGLLSTYLTTPFAMRRSVFSTSGFSRPNIERTGIVQSMHSAAVWYGLPVPGPCVFSGHTIGSPSQRAMR